MRIGLICTNRELRNSTSPHHAVSDGLTRLGHDVEIVAPGDWPIFNALPRVAFIWNGADAFRAKIVASLREAGVATFIMERGFFGRMNHTQIDPCGFNHTASWVKNLDKRAPLEGRSRFRAVWGRETDMQVRKRGYVLVVGQVAGDTQLRDSEIHHPQPFLDAVLDMLPPDIPIHVRPHPLSTWRPDLRGRAKLSTDTLKGAVLGARFIVTINSNVGNEAIAWGCPVLCLGPAIYAMADVARQTKLADLRTALADMLDGWRGDKNATRNYLYWLACRQWSNDELAEGKILAELLNDKC